MASGVDSRRAELSRHTVMVIEFWRRYKKNKAAVLGLLLLVIFIIGASFAGNIAKYEPLRTRVGPLLQPPGSDYWFGTDDRGKDVFSEVVYGTRTSMLVGAAAALGVTIIGVLVGTVSGYLGGRVDDLLMRFTEIVMIIPSFVLALVLIAIIGSSIWNIVGVIVILSWPRAARLVRADFLTLKEQQFVEASRAVGSSNLYIMLREILPNAMTSVIVNGSLQVASAILTEAGLSFLGLGDPAVTSWGKMMYESRDVFRNAPWTSIFPGGAIFLLSLAFNLVGDGISDALNPRLKER